MLDLYKTPLQEAYNISPRPVNVVMDSNGLTLTGSDTSFTQIKGINYVYENPVDQGQGVRFAQFLYVGKSIFTGSVPAVQMEVQLSQEAAGIDSGAVIWTVADASNFNDIFGFTGSKPGYGPRVFFGGTAGAGQYVQNVAINLGINDAPLLGAVFEVNSPTNSQGSVPFPKLTSTQINTIPLGSGVDGLFVYNTTNHQLNYFDEGETLHSVLNQDDVIAGTNMSGDINSDGSITLNSSGGSSPSTQESGAFACFQNGQPTNFSGSGYVPIVVDPASFGAVHQDNMQVTTMTIAGNITPIIKSTATGGTRWVNVSFNITAVASVSANQRYVFTIFIQQSGGGTTQTTYSQEAFFNLTSGIIEQAVTVGGLIPLNLNDFVFVQVQPILGTTSVGAYHFIGTAVDTTTAGIPLPLAVTSGGTGVSTTFTQGNVVIVGAGGAYSQSDDFVTSSQAVTTATQTTAIRNRYYINYAGGQCALTLPAPTGTDGLIEIQGLKTSSTSGWMVTAGTGDKIQVGNQLSAAAGNVQSSTGSATDCITLRDVAPNLWVAFPYLGVNLIVT